MRMGIGVGVGSVLVEINVRISIISGEVVAGVLVGIVVPIALACWRRFEN